MVFMGYCFCCNGAAPTAIYTYWPTLSLPHALPVLGGESGTGRRTENLLHHEEGPVKPLQIGFEKERLRHRKAGRMEGDISVVLNVALGLDEARHRIAAQDEGAHDLGAALLPRRLQQIGRAHV